MSMFTSGLVVGKFCPLHHGHQLLLDHAQAHCRQLTVVSYTKPGFPGMDADRRESWLSALYPHADHWVLDDQRVAKLCLDRGVTARELPHNDESDEVHRQFVIWLLHEIVCRSVDVVFTSESYGPGFADALCKAQLANGKPAVQHVMDAERIQRPVSGTLLRGNPHGLRQWLAPMVYKDFVRRVAIIGGESTGKSTLAQVLAGKLDTVHATEYGRELWEARQGQLVEPDLLHIAQTQIAREQALSLVANRVLLCDTTPLTTRLYAHAMFQRSDPELDLLACRSYDLWLLCDPDVPFVQDGTRRDDAFRLWQHQYYLRELEARGIPWVRLSGDWNARTATALAAMEAMPD